jgi:hypothetical protein
VQYAISVLDKKDPIQAMVVNVAEKPEQDSGRYDWERRAQANRFGSVEIELGDVKTGG